MADNDKSEEQTTSRGADWEVVQLTASNYAAASGATEVDLANENRETKGTDRFAKNEPSRALFMSDHFVFPPSEHENLPIEPDVTEIPGESESLSTDWSDGKEKLHKPSHNNPYEFHEEHDTVGYMTYTEGKKVQRLNLDEEDKESPGKHSKHDDEKKFDGSSLPCEAWLKRHAKGSNLWSIVLAATVVGIVIWGHRWQREKWQFQQHKWRFSIPDESIRRILGQRK